MDKKTRIIYASCIAVFTVCLLAVVGKWSKESSAQQKFEELSHVESETMEQETQGTESESEETIFTYLGIEDPKKQLDWEYLWEQNEDIYAWIYIPGTNVDYPILQHPTDDAYYLEYNLDGSKGYPGCIYTEGINSKDFSDYNTLIYGHNMKNGTMFADLHNFKDETFFKEHRYMFVYLPDEILVYDIFAAYKFTDAHIWYTYDCASAEGFGEYIDMVYGEYGNAGNFREDVTVTNEDRIITLSTCIGGQSDKRYLVQGVLAEYPE
uniref:class B sortase n=1 Tax=Agathobacter sp. TaxID=2021311 RepID=UPI004057025E